MIVAIDVQYAGEDANCGLAAFLHWDDAGAAAEFSYQVRGCEPYEPGNFYKRELPVILQTLAASRVAARTVVIDGFVDLGGGRSGLGRRLFDALGAAVPVVGVAKPPFHRCDDAVEVLRGTSRRPLYVSAAGLSSAEAARRVAAMHGPHRTATMLKLADSNARGHTKS